MKNNKLILITLALLLLLASSCKKAAYLTDGGIHSSKSPLSTYEYLRQHGWKSFDTLIMVVDKFNLKDEVNNAGTFFASDDYSIKKYMDLRLAQKKLTNDLAKYTLDSLYKDITADSIRQYLFREKIMLADVPKVQPAPFTSLANTTAAVFGQLQTATAYTQFTTGAVY